MNPEDDAESALNGASGRQRVANAGNGPTRIGGGGTRNAAHSGEPSGEGTPGQGRVKDKRAKKDGKDIEVFASSQRKRARRRKRGKHSQNAQKADPQIQQRDKAADKPFPSERHFSGNKTGGMNADAASRQGHDTLKNPTKKSSDKEAPPRKRSRRRKQRSVYSQGKVTIAGSPAAADKKLSGSLSVVTKIVDEDKKHKPIEHGFANGAQNNAQAGNWRSKQQPHSDMREQPLYAALDLGTNNCRLLIATPTRAGHFRVVDAFSRIVRLGEGLSTSGKLSEAAMDRAIEALKVCSHKLANKQIRSSRLIATEACRSAENGDLFLQRVRQETGLALEVVDRHTEARLAVSGCGTLIEGETEAVVLFDIGGGSSEIALIDLTQHRSSRLAEHISAWTSLPVGVVTLAEKFGGRNVTKQSFAAMVDHVAGLLDNFPQRDKLGSLAQGSRFHLLGTSGTVTTLAGIHLGLERYDRRRVDGMWMDNADVTKMTDRLLSWDFEARTKNPCIGSDRADLVLAGCAILDAIRNVWPSEKLLVADRGLREGILTELMSCDGAWRRRRHHNFMNRH